MANGGALNGSGVYHVHLRQGDDTMTEQMPINQVAAEQRLVEELTGATVPPKIPEHDEPVEAGDPVATTKDERPS